GGAALDSYAYDLAVVSAPEPGTACVTQEANCVLELDLTNLGSDPWSPLETVDGRVGSVRLVAWWRAGTETVPQIVDLPRSVFPGGIQRLTVVLAPPSSIPEGDARVELGLVQEGMPGFPGPSDGLPALELVIAS
ncbi:hypothetical protein, partial [Actinotalea sp.]|uniref:hypothetical protein n=1 Tax=Actinotalea sp. TaxID=1872145 RepID=UPI00356179BC